jgi:GT2 family glycosyltransferase
MSSTTDLPPMPDATAPLDLSVIMVTWNSLDVATAALESLRAQTRDITYEVIVVDNGSTRDDAPRELPHRFPWIRFLGNAENQGFSRANNQGMRITRGRYVLLLNADTLQTENALGASVQYLDEHPDVGALGILHRNADAQRTFQASFFRFPTLWTDLRRFFQRVPAPPPDPPIPGEQDVDWVCGSFLMIRRACLEQVGLLDERYFVYDEDIDWCLRAHQAGWCVRYWPGASLVHLGAQANPLMRDKTVVMFRSHLSYLWKNHGPFAAATYYTATGLALSLAAAKHCVRLTIGRSSLGDVSGRCRRLVQFVTLQPGELGCRLR